MDRSDFAAFYDVILLQEYSSLQPRPGEFILDAGANCGMFTVLAGRAVGPSGKIVAVESDPKNFQKLRRNVIVNGLNNVITVQKALWSTNDKILKTDGVGVMARVGASGTQKVRSTTVDSLSSDFGVTFDKMKIDVEGAECEALQGAQASLQKCRRLALEVEGEDHLREVRHHLTECGYDLRIANSSPILRSIKAVLKHPVVVLKTEGMNQFRTTARVIKDHSTLEKAGFDGHRWLCHATR